MPKLLRDLYPHCQLAILLADAASNPALLTTLPDDWTKQSLTEIGP